MHLRQPTHHLLPPPRRPARSLDTERLRRERCCQWSLVGPWPISSGVIAESVSGPGIRAEACPPMLAAAMAVPNAAAAEAAVYPSKESSDCVGVTDPPTPASSGGCDGWV